MTADCAFSLVPGRGFSLTAADDHGFNASCKKQQQGRQDHKRCCLLFSSGTSEGGVKVSGIGPEAVSLNFHSVYF